MEDEESNRFPPRFYLKLVNRGNSLSQMNSIYKFMICVQSEGKEDKHLTLNISGFGHKSLNEGM